MTSTPLSAMIRNGGFPLLWKAADNPYAATGKWILSTAGLVVGMVHVGGVTRLTGSGLSMTSWSVAGSLPPLSGEEWRAEFERYKTFPEWQQRKTMTLQDFQFIYWWEYGHRMLGRAVGVAFCLPWLYLTVRRKIPPGYQGRMALLAAMGGTQGLVGWWMVQSGLGEDRRGDAHQIRVKPVRLAAHLGMALATYGVLLWTGLDLLRYPHEPPRYAAEMKGALRHASRLRVGGIALTGLTALTVVSGALVAGNDAGRAYNTFPKMDGRWVPDGLAELQPASRNLTENTALVQWNHRVLATATALTAAGVAAVGGFGLAGPLSPAAGRAAAAAASVVAITPQVRRGLAAVGAAAAGQYALGVATLLHCVPLPLAAAHQLGSIALFSSAIYLVHSLRYARPALVRAAKDLPRAASKVAS